MAGAAEVELPHALPGKVQRQRVGPRHVRRPPHRLNGVVRHGVREYEIAAAALEGDAVAFAYAESGSRSVHSLPARRAGPRRAL